MEISHTNNYRCNEKICFRTSKWKGFASNVRPFNNFMEFF